jgi:hypothetical protein
MKRLLMAFVVAGLLGALSAPAVTATTTRIQTTSTTASSEVLNPGTWRYTGTGDQVQHVRGLVTLEMGNWNSPYALGPAYNTINWDLNMSTGRGAIWGTGVHYPTAFQGSQWNCSFRMPFDGMGGYAGKGVCQGTGVLDGWQWRVDLAVAPWGSTASGYIFKPGV